MKDNNNEIPKNEPPRPFPKYLPWSFEGHYQPWYDDRRDYNTNAPSYYDYLAHQKFLSDEAIELLNRVARRNIQVEDTNCVKFTKTNDWIDEGNPCETWHDIITLKCEVVLSTYKKAISFDGNDYTLNNIISCLNDGLYSPDYLPILTHLKNKLNQEIEDRKNADNALNAKIDKEITDRTNADNNLRTYIDSEVNRINSQISQIASNIENLTTRVNNLQGSIQKIVTNLYEGGNATSNDINNYQINNNIAAGNINIYAQTAGSNTLIKTHATNTNKEGDIVVGLSQEAPK